MAKGSLLVLVALAAILAAQLKPAVAAGVDGRYSDAMQKKVRAIVDAKIYDAPGLIRLVFHDCWVKGCDASVLLNNTKDQNEIHAVQNGGLRGMDVVQEVKKALSADYKNVSCTDAIIFAAREATILLSKGGITYDVDGPGRKDSLNSTKDDAGVLPGPGSSFQQLVDNFAGKGFDAKDMVVFSGAHGIGRAHRPTFNDRLNKTITPDTQINPKYREAIDKKTSIFPSWWEVLAGANKPSPDMSATAENNVRDMKDVREYSGYTADAATMAAKGVLDNSYYTANLQNMVLFNSDWALRTNTTAEQQMKDYKNNAKLWYVLFGDAMYRLSKLPSQGPFVAGGARDSCDKI